MFRQVLSGVITAITILAIFVPYVAKGAETGDTLLETIPAESIFCVRINKLNQTTGVLDQFLMGVAPVTTGGFIKGHLGMMFGNFELKGFDLNGSFAIFATAESDKQPPDIYFLLPVTDYSQVIDPNFRVTAPDGNGISTVGTGPKGQFFMKHIRSYALMAKNYNKLGDMAGAISGEKANGLIKALDKAKVEQAASEPVWCYVNMEKVSSTYSEVVSSGIEEIKQQAANPGAGIQKRIDNLEQTKIRLAAADTNHPAIGSINEQIEALKERKQRMELQKTPAMMGDMMDAFGILVKDFMQQSKSVILLCNPKPDVLNFTASVNALPGTEMASMLVAYEHPAKNDLMGFAEDGAVMNIAGWLDHEPTKTTYAKFIDLMAKVTGEDSNSADMMKMKSLCNDMVDSMGDRLFCSFSAEPNTKPPFDAKYILAVKDAEKFNKTTDEFVEMWKGSVFDALYKSMGMETSFEIKRGVDKYKDITIDAATLSIKLTDTNSPEGQMINAMYGKGFDYRWAVVDGLWVCRISSDPNAIYGLIDKVKAGAPEQLCPEMQKAIAVIPDAGKADVIFTYNYLRLFKIMSAMMPVPMPQMSIPSKSNLVFAARSGNGTVSFDAALPKEHVQEMMMVFQMMMQMQMQQQQMQKMPQGAPMQMSPANQ